MAMLGIGVVAISRIDKKWFPSGRQADQLYFCFCVFVFVFCICVFVFVFVFVVAILRIDKKWFLSVRQADQGGAFMGQKYYT